MSGLILLGILPLTLAWSSVEVMDDAGNRISLAQPARRIVSLAPYITELLFAAGAGAALVGASEFSDYPGSARKIPRIGGGNGLDLEAIMVLEPDLVIAWKSGNPPGAASRLQQLGLTVFMSEPRRLQDVMSSLERFGLLAGTEVAANRQASLFERRYKALQQRYSQQESVRVFYQIWDRPLMTVNGEHLISDVIRLCGGRNVFAGLPALAPQITIEAVLAADPDVIVVGSEGEGSSPLLKAWWRWSELAAVENRQLFSIPRELMVRHTPRILEGAERLCRILDGVREGAGK